MKKAMIVAALLTLGACTPANPPQANSVQGTQGINAQQVTYGLFGPGPINYGEIRNRDDYYYDGEINHSPSFRTLSTTRQDLGDDEEIIRSVVLEEGFRPGSVIIAGHHAWINVHAEGMESNERKQKIKELQTSLHQTIPRYDVHVNETTSS
ncbi:hypothetical protein [Bacillus alkalicellulosilyticus]|uniref:hypothetical protein n=1 Tax=Alkalihalobacterium alkalicellulosilyticum TaxID=1912214 RepID=UPI0009985326|nr:hypothetical protein [Bacillus alkalicellulosilyticus]